MVSLGRLRSLVLMAAAILVVSPPASGQTAKSGEAQPQLERKNETAGGAYAPKPRDRGPGLSGRATWGQGGAVRIVLLQWPPVGEKSDLRMRVRFVNEGQEDFTLEPADSWAVRTEKGTRIGASRRPLRAEASSAAESITIAPHTAIEIELRLADPPRQTIVSLEYRSPRLAQIVEARAPYLEPTPRLLVPPVYPQSALEAGARERVRLSIVVGIDGKAEQIFVLSPPAEDDAYGFRDAAVQAVHSWVFEPALENKEPQRGLYEDTLVFANSRITRAVFPLPVVEIALRLSRLLQESFPASVVPLPHENGFVVNEGVRSPDDRARARAFLLRIGEESPGKSTWISIGSMALQARTTSAGCSCADWAADPGSPDDLLQRISSSFGVDPAQVVTLAPQGETLLPSGSPEPEASGRWRRDTLRRMLRAALQPSGAAEKEDLRPSEEDLVRASQPLLVYGDVRPPEKITDVSPNYPEEARSNRVEGKVILEAVIDARGEVSELKVLRSIPELEQSAIDAVCCWKYRPATKGGRPVPVYFTIVVEYNLKKTESPTKKG
ncbi:MAG: hypothetical protein DMF49_10935 [Acidobacteria bacterium]|nr:MAG: hypothetical protein DMF49_10935 [Acidobacteriota bacterium]